MKALAVLRLTPGIEPDIVAATVPAEIAQLWQLYLEQKVTAAYLTDNPTIIVLELDGDTVEDIRRGLDRLPMIKQGMLGVELHALLPFRNWEHLAPQS